MKVKSKTLADYIWQGYKTHKLVDERHEVKEGDYVFGIFYDSPEVFMGKVEYDPEYKGEDELERYSFECHKSDGNGDYGSVGFLSNAEFIGKLSTIVEKDDQNLKPEVI